MEVQQMICQSTVTYSLKNNPDDEGGDEPGGDSGLPVFTNGAFD